MSQPCAVQVVVDCVSPHTLADWWAETLAWEVERQDETFIRSMIEQGFATDSDTQVHQGSLVWSSGAAIRPPGEPSAGQPRLLFQQVPDAVSLAGGAVIACSGLSVAYGASRAPAGERMARSR